MAYIPKRIIESAEIEEMPNIVKKTRKSNIKKETITKKTKIDKNIILLLCFLFICLMF